MMDFETFQNSLQSATPPSGIPRTIEALWWDARGDWTRAHSLVDEVETPEGMAVHAYLHRKEGAHSNADYWYHRAGRSYYRAALPDEWQTLVTSLLSRLE